MMPKNTGAATTKLPRSFAWLLLAVLALSVIAGPASAAPSKRSIEKSIKRSLETFHVPGMAVSVVKDGKVVYAGGEGVIEAGGEQRVDADTLFQIGSVSKAFTTAALAILVDEGQLGWDDRVIDHLPEFRMQDPWVTREFTIRDLLTHRSGLPLGAGDLLLFPQATSTVDEIIHALRYLTPSTSFRSEFAYDNLMFIVAGEVVARISGMPFEDFLEQRLLSPLGMDDCSATLERVKPGLVKATPHMLVGGQLEITLSGITPVSSAAGGINCSARSMTRWMNFMLNRGVTEEGVRVISEAQVDQLLKPVTMLPTRAYMAEHAGTFLSAYALGWDISTFYGQPMISHSGGVLGMTTFLVLLPHEDLGIFVSNNQMSPAPRAVANDLADQFLKGRSQDAGQDWIAIISDLYSAIQSEGAATVADAEAARNADSRPSLPLSAYTGTYRDDWYGDISITQDDDGRLWFQSGRSEALHGALEHFQYDTFIARWDDRRLNADAYVSFTMSPEGRIERIRMKAVSPTTDFSFDFHDLDLRRVE
jgi:CubicO group peptidase (beta-lactamase class C family)